MKDKFLDGKSIEDIFNGIKEGNISGRDIKVWAKPFDLIWPHLTCISPKDMNILEMD